MKLDEIKHWKDGLNQKLDSLLAAIARLKEEQEEAVSLERKMLYEEVLASGILQKTWRMESYSYASNDQWHLVLMDVNASVKACDMHEKYFGHRYGSVSDGELRINFRGHTVSINFESVTPAAVINKHKIKIDASQIHERLAELKAVADKYIGCDVTVS